MSDTEWLQIGGPTGQILTGSYKLYATNPDNGSIFKYNDEPHNWSHIGGPASVFVASADNLFGLSPDKSGVYKWSGLGSSWSVIGGAAEKIYGATINTEEPFFSTFQQTNLFATNPDNGDVYSWNGNTWQRRGGPGSMFASNHRGLFGLTPNKNGVWMYVGVGNIDWIKIGGPAEQIITGTTTLFATNPQTGNIFKWNDSAFNWTQIGGPGSMFTAGRNELCGLNPDKSGIFRWNGTEWQNIGGPAESIALDRADSIIYAIFPDKTVWKKNLLSFPDPG